MKTWMKNLILSILAIIAVIIFHEQIWQGILYVLSFFLGLIIDFVSLLIPHKLSYCMDLFLLQQPCPSRCNQLQINYRFL
jgi:hypothetical protein